MSDIESVYELNQVVRMETYSFAPPEINLLIECSNLFFQRRGGIRSVCVKDIDLIIGSIQRSFQRSAQLSFLSLEKENQGIRGQTDSKS